MDAATEAGLPTGGTGEDHPEHVGGPTEEDEVDGEDGGDDEEGEEEDDDMDEWTVPCKWEVWSWGVACGCVVVVVVVEEEERGVPSPPGPIAALPAQDTSS